MLADKYKELSPEKIELRKRIAKLRHTATPYDKHLRLMYDEEGNQTDLRKEINRIISKVVRAKLNMRCGKRKKQRAKTNMEMVLQKHSRPKIKRQTRENVNSSSVIKNTLPNKRRHRNCTRKEYTNSIKRLC